MDAEDDGRDVEFEVELDVVWDLNREKRDFIECALTLCAGGEVGMRGHSVHSIAK
jgi:hypothetical protein